MRVLYDLVIVGGGAAGLTAALYASRSGLDCIVLDPSSPEGSSIALTDAVENYTGFSDIAGFDLIQHFYSHAKSFGANFVRQALVGIRKNYDGFILECSDSEVKTKSVILCMGATHKKLGIDGENKFEGRGVSYCAVCDGYFFKDKTMTDKIFGVNIMLMSPFAEEVSDVVVEEGIKVITTGAGNPGKYMAKWLEAGIKVIPVVPSVALARKMEKDGAFAVIAEGGESGGHVGDLTTMALVPQVVDAVNIPVIAAGGIADGRQIAAAFMLGAQGVQVGTRFLVAKECTISQEYKNKILKARDIDTVVTGKRLGHPVRSIRNSFTREYTKAEYDSANVSDEELENMGLGRLRRAVREGDVSQGTVLAGQVASMVKKEQPAREMIEEMFSQAEEVLNGATKWVK